MSQINVERISPHRNGSGGERFYVVLFRDEELPGQRMVGVVFGGPQERRGGDILTAVLDRDLLAAGRIAMHENACFRGDAFDDQLRNACQAWEDARRDADDAVFRARERGALPRPQFSRHVGQPEQVPLLAVMDDPDLDFPRKRAAALYLLRNSDWYARAGYVAGVAEALERAESRATFLRLLAALADLARIDRVDLGERRAVPAHA